LASPPAGPGYPRPRLPEEARSGRGREAGGHRSGAGDACDGALPGRVRAAAAAPRAGHVDERLPGARPDPGAERQAGALRCSSAPSTPAPGC
jgi:hypothetical protein